MDTSPAVRERIITAADTLYEESGHRNIPTVDAVRKLAKVNINDASNCMREWRRSHAALAETPQHQVPEKLQLTCATALNALWTEAMNLSGETLRMARAGWDAERADVEAFSEQIANACAAQGEELLAAKAAFEKQAQDVVQLNELLAVSQRRCEAAERTVVELRAAVSHAEARSQEIERRANHLHQALEQTHASHTAVSNEQAAAIRLKGDEITSLRAELSAVRQKLESNAATAQAALLAAIEETARLRGKLDAMSDESRREASPSKHSTGTTRGKRPAEDFSG